MPAGSQQSLYIYTCIYICMNTHDKEYTGRNISYTLIDTDRGDSGIRGGVEPRPARRSAGGTPAPLTAPRPPGDASARLFQHGPRQRPHIGRRARCWVPLSAAGRSPLRCHPCRALAGPPVPGGSPWWRCKHGQRVAVTMATQGGAGGAFERAR